MNAATAYKYDDTAPLPTATRQRVVEFARLAANDGIYENGIIQLHPLPNPLPNPLPQAGEGANGARCADQTLDDANGNRTSLTDPDNKVTRYSFDELNRVSTVTNGGGTTTYSYDRSSLKTEVSYPNGTTAATTYDRARRILTLVNLQGSAPVSSFSYSYDANGNRTQQLENLTGADEVTDYAFDDNDRLAIVSYPDQVTFYAFDANANRLTEVSTANSATTLNKIYTYNTRNQLTKVADGLTPANDAVYSFDANGNQTRKTQGATVTAYAYDVKDQLLSVSQNNANIGVFSYDYQGHRIVKDMGGSIVRYAYDGNSVLLETDNTGTTLAKFDYGPDRLLSMTHASEGRAYYLFDALGSVSNLTNTAGAIQARYQYDAYGNYRSTAGASFNRFAFTGHEKDNETNLYYFKARYYDPDTGRFLNQDAKLGEINNPPSLHRYLYAYANPTVYVDPDGRSATVLGGITGFFWGFGQMVGGMGSDALNGNSRSTSEYLGVWGQNIVAGVETGASIDAAVLTGGTGYAVSGALGGAGLNSLTVSGKGSSAQEFAHEQIEGAAWGAAGGAVLSKVAPVLSKGAQWVGERIPESVMAKAGAVVNKAAAAASDVADQAGKAMEPASSTIANAWETAKSVITREGDGMATSKTVTPAAQRSVDAVPSVGENSAAPAEIATPTLRLSREEYPNHTKMLENAQEKGHSLEGLERGAGTRAAASNRYHAQKEIRKEKGAPPEGHDYDEFPYASTKQGGAGSHVEPVISEENQAAGRKLGAFYRENNIKENDKFDIEITD